jgi:hypothetical protein
MAKGTVMRLIRGQGQPAVEGVSNRSCTVVFLFSKTGLGEPFAAAEGICMGLDRETREGRRRGKKPTVMYTGSFVQ